MRAQESMQRRSLGVMLLSLCNWTRQKVRVSPVLMAAVLIAMSFSMQAAEAPGFQVNVQNQITVYTATPASSNVPGFKPHVNFPYLKSRADGTLEMDFTVGQTHGSGVFGLRGYSSDGGLSWGGFTSSPPSTPNSSLVKPSGQTSYGVSYAMSNPAGQTSWNNTLYTSINGGTNWSIANAAFDSNGVSYTNVYNNITDMVPSGPLLFTTGYAQRLGKSTSETVLFSSADNGSHWTRRSTIAAYTNDPTVAMGSEGPSESSIVRLNSGNLLSVFRTSQTFPSTEINATNAGLMWSMSTDDGISWTTAKTLGVAGEFPLLHRLDDGSAALTFGRYGAKVMFVDETGLRWTTPTVIYNGPGSGHTDLKKTANGTYAFVYDQSSFYPPSYNATPPAGYVYNNDLSGNAKAAILGITRTQPKDDYAWALQYHGDVTPDKAPYGWQKTVVGSVSTREWADLGQDYVRLSTGGASNELYYTLSGEGSSWHSMNFANGVATDVRARCSLGTTEGAADVYLSDATHGNAVLKLTGAGVLLEGLGGAGQEASYLSAEHPGFNIFDFHTYRIAVAPDASQGNALFANVFLDGDLSSPILTRHIGTSALDLLRFGDETGVNNGTFDVDLVRFASVPEPGALSLIALVCLGLLCRARSSGRPLHL